MSKEQFTPQSNENGRPVIEIPKSVVKIGAAALATLGLAGAANTLGLFYSPKSPEKGPSPAHQVAQVVEDYSNGVITELPEEYNEENPENKIDPNEARSSIYETATYMKDLYKSKTGDSEIHPGTTVNIAIGDMNGDGKPSIAITRIEDGLK